VRFWEAVRWSKSGVASYVVKEPGCPENPMTEEEIEEAFCLSSRLNVKIAQGQPVLINDNHYAADRVPDLIENSVEWEPFPPVRDAISELGSLTPEVELGHDPGRGPGMERSARGGPYTS